MADTNPVVHSRFKFKPEGSDKYVTVLLESTAKDVLVETPVGDFYDGNGTLEDLLVAIENNVARRPVIMSKKDFVTQNYVLHEGQLGIERDTGLMKIGDGHTGWNDLDLSFNGETVKVQFSMSDTTDIYDKNGNNVGKFDDSKSLRNASVEVEINEVPLSINIGNLTSGTETDHEYNVFFERK